MYRNRLPTFPFFNVLDDIVQINRHLIPEKTIQRSSLSPWLSDFDIKKTDDKYHVLINLPGVSSNQLEVKEDNNQLLIKVIKVVEKEETGEWIRKERKVFEGEQRFTLPSDVKKDEISAKLKNGVLEVVIPRITVSESKAITVFEE